MDKNAKIYVAGHRGLVGSAILRKLESLDYKHIIKRTHHEMDLENLNQVSSFFEEEKPEYVFLAAAKVGGILANKTYPADFIYKNLMVQNHVIHQSYKHGVKKLLFLGSSCIYPKLCKQPMQETDLMTGPLESTNSPYAVAKIAGIEMCWAYNRQYRTNFIPVMPTNLYGPNDNFDLETSHVLPALIRKFIEAKENKSDSVILWGTGSPKREFLYVDDMADACVYLMKKETYQDVSNEMLLFNIGTGTDVTIQELAETIRREVGFQGKIIWDAEKPDGTPQKLLDVNRMIKQGWASKTILKEGLKRTITWYLENRENIRR